MAEANKGWPPQRVDEWCASVKDEQKWLLEKLMPADAAILVSGKAKRAYKSWIAFQVAICLSTGRNAGPLVPVDTAGIPVLVLEAEGARASTRDRWRWLASGNELRMSDLKNIHFSHRANIFLDSSVWLDQVCKYIETHGIKFVIVDPLAMFSQGDENSSRDMVRLMHSFVSMKAQSATVMFCHHLTKTQQDWVRDIDEEVRGSSAIAGFYDQHWGLRKKQDTQRYLDLMIRSKDGPEHNFELEWEISEMYERASFTMTKVEEGQMSGRAKGDALLKLKPRMTYTLTDLQRLWGCNKMEASELVFSFVDTGKVQLKDGTTGTYMLVGGAP